MSDVPPNWVGFVPVVPSEYEGLSQWTPTPSAVRSYADGAMIAKLYRAGLVVLFDKDDIGRAFYRFKIDEGYTFEDLLVKFLHFRLAAYSALALGTEITHPDVFQSWVAYSSNMVEWNNRLKDLVTTW